MTTVTTALCQLQAEMVESDNKKHLMFLRENDPEVTRLDISAPTFRDWPLWRKDDFINSLPLNHTVSTLHVSGFELDEVLNDEQIERLFQHVSQMTGVRELFCFHGGSAVLAEDRLASILPKNLQVLMLWQFERLSQAHKLAAAIRNASSLERITIKIPRQVESKEQEWGCLDVFAMAFASLPNLKVLQCKCVDFKARDPIFSPEALAVLLRCPTLHSLYLENCGLLDDHIDVMHEELSDNVTSQLQVIDFQENCLTDDTIYTFGRMLPGLLRLRGINISGVQPITDEAGQCLAKGLELNSHVVQLELEGTAARYADEFFIPESPHADADWMRLIDYRIRLNRAYREAPNVMSSVSDFCDALTAVSDHDSALFHFVRTYPKYTANLSPISMQWLL
jgi:hypothetical protein